MVESLKRIKAISGPHQIAELKRTHRDHDGDPRQDNEDRRRAEKIGSGGEDEAGKADRVEHVSAEARRILGDVFMKEGSEAPFFRIDQAQEGILVFRREKNRERLVRRLSLDEVSRLVRRWRLGERRLVDIHG